MIHQSCRASPGSGSAARPICTWRLVFVTVPFFSGQAEAGRTTSAYFAVSVRKMSCTTRCSSLASASRACSTSGSDIAGFSPMMYMPLISPRMDRVHDLDHGEAALGVERGLPQRLEVLADLGVVDRLVVGVDHRDQAGVRGALDVVLAAERVQAGARPADLAGHQRQRDQAARVVGAVDVLRDAHAPEDDRRLGARVDARDVAQGRGVDAADRAPSSRAKIPDVLAQVLEIVGMRLDVLPVVEAFLDDRVQQRVQQRHVACRA